MVRCVVTGAIRAALLVSTCLCPCYKGCCSVTCLESTFQAHRGTFPAWDKHPSIGDAGVAISWPSLPVRTRGACFPRVQDRGCPGEPAQKQPCWCSPGCSRCLAWTGAPGLRRGQPPPRPHLWAGRDGGKPAYLQLQGAFTPCLLLLLALPSPLHLQKYIPQPAQTSAWTAGDRQCALVVVPLQGS